MANALYAKGKEGLVSGDIQWPNHNIKLALIDEADDAIDLVNDDNWDDRAAAARVAISANLSGKTATNGVCDAADVTLNSVVGDQAESIDFFRDTGLDSTSRLLMNIDTATGLPITPNSGNIVIQFDDGANKIFALAP